MRKLNGLSGEYVTFDQNGQNATSHSKFLLEHLTGKIDGFHELVTLFKRLDKSGRVGLTDMLIYEITIWT